MTRTIWISIAVALVVQGISLVLLRRVPRERILLAWGIGSLLRLIVLFLYGGVVVPALGLPLAPALLTLVAVFLVTMFIEPFLLRGSAKRSPTLNDDIDAVERT